MWGWKEALVASGWTVVGSCGYNGSIWVAGMDGIDRWTSADAVTGRTGDFVPPYDGTYSWIVLRNLAMSSVGGGYQILISPEMYDANNNWPIYIRESYGGFYTGGSTEAKPTASDEVPLLDSYPSDAGGVVNRVLTVSGNYTRGVTVLTSTDGQCTRNLFSSAAGTVLLVVSFERVQDARTWWDKPVIAGVSRPTYVDLNTAQFGSNVKMMLRAGSTLGIPAYFSADGFGTAGVAGKQTFLAGPDPNGNWMCSPVGLIGTAGGTMGYVGRLADAYWVHENMANGDYYPDDGTMKWVVFGDLMHASDGTAVVID